MSSAPPARTAAPRRARPFRRRGALHTRLQHFGPNMTPMVDVVMVILVFFMASAAFVTPEWFLRALVPIKAPPLGTGSSAPNTANRPVPQELLLDVNAAGATTVTGLGLTGATLEEGEKALEALVHDPSGALAAQLELMLRPTASVPYRDVVRLHETAARLGIQRIGIGSR